MQNRFGFKDLVTLVLLLALGIGMFLIMAQRDRLWDQSQKQSKSMSDLEQQIAQMRRSVEGGAKESPRLAEIEKQVKEIRAKLESGIVAVAPGSAATGGAKPEATKAKSAADPAKTAATLGSTTTAALPPTPPGDAWAKAGVPIERQPAWGPSTDATTLPGYRDGGTFTQIFEARPAKITPYIQTDVYGRRAVDLVMQPAADYDPKTLKLRGIIAEAWQADPQGKWVRVRIRDEARHSDGQPVTAEDFRWTFHEFIMNPQIEAERQRSTLRDNMDRVEVLSEKVYEVHFKGDPYFLNIDNALTMWPLPKHFYSKFTPAQINQGTGLLMGSGPFKLADLNPDKQWTPEDPIVLVRNEQYWGPRPSLDAVRFKALNQELARLTEFTNDEADMITPASTQFVSKSDDKEFASKNTLIKTVNMRSGRAGLIWNCGNRPGGDAGKPTPFTDVRVRRAMTLLLDRERIIRDIYRGIGQVATGFFNPNTPGDDPNLKPLPFDRTAGMKLLAEAGWIDRDKDGQLEDAEGRPFTFELTYPSGSEISDRIAKFVLDSYADAGIKVALRPMDWSVMDPVRDQRNFDCLMMGWGANAPESDPKQIFHSESIKNQGDNFGQWSSPRADAAIDAARRELDATKRAELWKQFSRVMHEEQPYTWVRVTPELRFVKPWIGNVQTYPKGLETWEFFRGSGALPSTGQ